jgi:DNA-binding response OmpR family regulator
MAARLLTFRRYDAVIADLEFENWQCTKGVDLVRAARRRGGDAVVVLLTSAGDAAPEALAAGADFVVRKPMPLDMLADLILEQRRRATGAGAPPLRPRAVHSRQSPLT